jgi:hypothetical protein
MIYLKKYFVWPVLWVTYWPLWTFFAFVAGTAMLGILVIDNLDERRHREAKGGK